MRTRMWLKLVEEKRPLLKEALKQAYCRAAGFQSDEWQEEVLLKVNGNITIHSYPIFGIPMEVINGDSIYVGTIKWFKYIPPTDEGENDRLELKAIRWAEDQLHILLQDLRYTAEFEELEVTYV